MKGFLTQWRPPERLVDYSATLEKQIADTSTGGTLLLPAGVINLSRTFVINKQMTVQGAGSQETTVRTRFNGVEDVGGDPEGDNFLVFNESGIYDLLSPANEVTTGDGRKLISSVAQGATTLTIERIGTEDITINQYFVLVGGERAYHIDGVPTNVKPTQIDIVYVTAKSAGANQWTLTISAPTDDPNNGPDSPYTSVATGGVGAPATHAWAKSAQVTLLGKLIRTSSTMIRTGFHLEGVTFDGSLMSGIDSTSGRATAIFGGRREAVVGFTGCVASIIKDIRISGFTGTGLTLNTCRNARIVDCQFANAPVGGLGYSIALNSCRGVFVGNSEFHDVRNGVMMFNGTSDVLVRGAICHYYPPGTLPSGDSYKQQGAIVDIGHGQGARRGHYTQVSAPFSTVNFANPSWRIGSFDLTLSDSSVLQIYLMCNATNISVIRTNLAGNVSTFTSPGVVGVSYAEIKLHCYENGLAHYWNGYAKSLTLEDVILNGFRNGPVIWQDPETFDQARPYRMDSLIIKETTSGTSDVERTLISNKWDLAGSTLPRCFKIELGAGNSAIALGIAGSNAIPRFECPNGEYFMDIKWSNTTGQPNCTFTINKTKLDGTAVVPPHILLGSGTRGSLSGTGNLCNLTGGTGNAVNNVAGAPFTVTVTFTDI